jgi:lysozyme family protein
MRENYEACQAITLKWEGGDSDNPKDPGGATRWGITQATYDHYRDGKHCLRQHVFYMTREEMLEIYKAGYWDAVNGDNLPVGVDLATWDYGVNSGPARANSALRAVKSVSAVSVVKELCAKRMSFLHGLKTFSSFGKGWSNRVADIEAKGVAMALKASSPATAKAQLLDEANAASKAAISKGNAAVKAAPASGVSAITAQYAPDQWVSSGLLVFGFLAVAVAIWLVIKARHDDARELAYRNAASEAK